MRSTVLASGLALSALALAACSASANLTIPASSVAEEAERILEEQIGSRPEIDCGDESVDLVDGTEVDCLLTDPVSGSEFDMTATLSDVDGTKYTLNVQVADAPNNAATEGTEAATETAEAESPANLDVPNSQLANLAAGALEGELGYAPTITCAEGALPLKVDQYIQCGITGPDGNTRSVRITITSVEGTDFTINAEVL